ncbi:hypothetical protein F2Q68_00034013 [Brassica cretica]|uniref:Uncharacterized protein n=1 Tax=Brassica cretica TaxID=69181 RepID=A0A8S9H5Y6_BRACR|nr:hypothetical protein F2Q68_00034013 [Brassica cretica]
MAPGERTPKDRTWTVLKERHREDSGHGKMCGEWVIVDRCEDRTWTVVKERHREDSGHGKMCGEWVIVDRCENQNQLDLEWVLRPRISLGLRAGIGSCNIRRASHVARRDVAGRYREILVSLKEKWMNKKNEVSAEIQLQEVVANIDLLNELKDGGLTVDAELARLKEMEKDCEVLVTLAAVSDWSISELDLPQVSEDSVDQAGGSSVPDGGLSQYSDRFLFPPAEKTWHLEGRPFVNPNGYEIELVALVWNASDPETPTGSEGRDHPLEKAKTNGTDHHLGVSGDTADAKPFHWQSSHSKDCPITEDPNSVSHLVRHFKPVGCPLPSLRNMTEREAYVKMVLAHAKAMEANNEFAATLERCLQDFPRSDELYKITKAATLEARLRVMSNESKSALEQVSFLEAKVESSAYKFSEDLRRATHDAKKALADSYLDVLESLKENWEKKKAATDCEPRLREVMANIDLLKEIMNNNLLAPDELLHLRTKEVELGSELDVMTVSDFSAEKLDLPQI